jgi:ubiquinone/menaquinone biosynthesis C-methylase UbiE
MENNTDKIRKRYNRAAKFFDLTESMMERGKMSRWREMVWKEANGRVLEVGVGTGKNIQYYPNNAEVTAIDFSEKMLERARNKAEKLGRKIDLRLMDVQKLDFPDETFDTIMTTCVFCSVPDPVRGLEEIRRVCKKDGKIIMLEHVRSKNPIAGIFMDMLNPVVVRVVGANINRDTVENLKRAGLSVEVEANLMMDIVKHLKCSKDGAEKST